MPVSDLPVSPVDFEAVLGKLAGLSRKHYLAFRLEVGRTVAEDFFGGELGAYRDQAGNKDSSLRHFARQRYRELADLGLDEDALRRSVLGWFVFRELPKAVAKELMFTHLFELSRVPDDATRRLLATAAVDNRWDGAEMRGAVLAVRAGRWPDADGADPGLQPATVEAPVPRAPQPGRVVNRFERTADAVDALVGEWEQVAVDRLTELQSTRVKEALGRLEQRIARLRARLP